MSAFFVAPVVDEDGCYGDECITAHPGGNERECYVHMENDADCRFQDAYRLAAFLDRLEAQRRT